MFIYLLAKIYINVYIYNIYIYIYIYVHMKEGCTRSFASREYSVFCGIL